MPGYNDENIQLQQPVERRELAIKSGPLPDPEVLSQYDKALPGTAEKIVKVFEDQVKHRMQIETEQMELKRRQMTVIEGYAKDDSRNSLLGIMIAGLLGIASIGLGAYAVHNGNATAGAVTSSVGIGSIVGAFIYGTRASHRPDKGTK